MIRLFIHQLVDWPLDKRQLIRSSNWKVWIEKWPVGYLIFILPKSSVPILYYRTIDSTYRAQRANRQHSELIEPYSSSVNSGESASWTQPQAQKRIEFANPAKTGACGHGVESAHSSLELENMLTIEGQLKVAVWKCTLGALHALKSSLHAVQNPQAFGRRLSDRRLKSCAQDHSVKCFWSVNILRGAFRCLLVHTVVHIVNGQPGPLSLSLSMCGQNGFTFVFSKYLDVWIPGRLPTEPSATISFSLGQSKCRFLLFDLQTFCQNHRKNSRHFKAFAGRQG